MTAPEGLPRKIISGGQTGVDRAALDVALELGLPCGGWCPRGRRAEDGPIPLHYPLQETRSDSYAGRTARNVRQSDGTLVLTDGRPDRGTALTIRLARRHARPLLLLNLAAEPRPGLVAAWIVEHGIGVLNVAGPRASSHRGIYEKARRFLHGALAVSRPG